jgi:putative DNA primase/helicase
MAARKRRRTAPETTGAPGNPVTPIVEKQDSPDFSPSMRGNVATDSGQPGNTMDNPHSGVTDVIGVTASNGAGSSGNTEISCDVTCVTGPSDLAATLEGGAFNPVNDPTGAGGAGEFPEPEDRPCYRVYDDWCGKDGKEKPGVYYHGVKEGGEDQKPAPFDIWLCDPLHVEAITRDADGHSFGFLLHFRDRLGTWKFWNMPQRMMKGSGEDLRGELLDLGLYLDIRNKMGVPVYINSQHPKRTLRAALQVGWSEGVFVLPDRTIGDGEQPTVFYQSEHTGQKEYTTHGDLDGWRKTIARYCIGNPLLLFSVSAAFAGPLLRPCHQQGAGFHVFGGSRCGKSSGMKLACSVWGDWETYARTWKATANGLEGAACLFNDGLLALDEMSDGEPEEIRKTIYALYDGRGKQRGNVNGGARALRRWRVVTLSNGERTIEAQLSEKGITAKAGQLNRLLQFPVFGTHGAFDDLHGHANGGQFSDRLTADAQRHYGTAGLAFLEKLAADVQAGRDFSGLLARMVPMMTEDELTWQEASAAKAFALVAMAGELATEYGISGWPEKAAFDAARTCFLKWREHRGFGNIEHTQILKTVGAFLDLHGDSRFTNYLDRDAKVTAVAGRAGYWREAEGDGREWLFTAAGLREATKGFDLSQVTANLKAAGWLIPAKDGKPSQTVKISGEVKRVYVLRVPEGGFDHA